MRRTRDDVNDRDLLYIDTNARTVNKVGRGMEAGDAASAAYPSKISL